MISDASYLSLRSDYLLRQQDRKGTIYQILKMLWRELDPEQQERLFDFRPSSRKPHSRSALELTS